jgi:Mg/Co/Ni transporter MgtE
MSEEIRDKINDALYNFYLEADKETIADSIEDGVKNIEEYNKKKKQILFFVRAQANKQRDQRLLALAEKFREAVEKNIDRPIAILKQIIQGESSLAFYSNLDKLTKEDIVEIIKDKNLVELLEQLENNDGKH